MIYNVEKNGPVEIGIIGGTGAKVELKDAQSYKVYTPYGETSDLVQVGTFEGRKVAFIPRHGLNHQIPPHKVPYRANIWALHSIGVSRIISPCAVGGLTHDTQEGVFVVVDQYIDRTKARKDTFYEGGPVCHLSQAEPYCPETNKLFYETGKELGLNIAPNGTYVCIQGPRFSTRAESMMFRQWGADIIGMTSYPEVVLAGELNMCYTAVAMVTDLDCWAAECKECKEILIYGEKCPKCGKEATPLIVDGAHVVKTMQENEAKLKKLMNAVIPKIPKDVGCNCSHRTDGAIM